MDDKTFQLPMSKNISVVFDKLPIYVHTSSNWKIVCASIWASFQSSHRHSPNERPDKDRLRWEWSVKTLAKSCLEILTFPSTDFWPSVCAPLLITVYVNDRQGIFVKNKSWSLPDLIRRHYRAHSSRHQQIFSLFLERCMLAAGRKAMST